MGFSEAQLFGWEELNEKEKAKKRELYRNFMTALSGKQIEEAKKLELNKVYEPIIHFKASIKQEKAAEIAHEIGLKLVAIKEAKDTAKKRIENVTTKNANESADDQVLQIATQLIIACDFFSQAKDKTQAATLSETIKTNLEVVMKSEANIKASGLSKGMLEQAAKAVEIGEIIKEGLAALKSEFDAKSINVELAPAKANENLAKIMKMQLVSPSDILVIKSKELDDLNSERLSHMPPKAEPGQPQVQ